MSGFRGHPVTVTGGTRGGIAEAAGAQDDGVGGDPFPGRCPDGGNLSAFRLQRADLGVQPDADAGGTHQGREGLGDVAGFLRRGEDPAAALHRHRAAGAFQQGHHVLRGEKGQGGIEKTGIAGNLGKKGIQVAVVCQVAPPFSGNINFLAQLFIPFQQGDGSPGPGGKQRGGHSRGSAADYNDVRHGGLPPDKRDRISRYPPGGGNAR